MWDLLRRHAVIVKCFIVTMRQQTFIFKYKREWLFEEGLSVSRVLWCTHFAFTLDKKQEVIITHILTYCKCGVFCWQLAKDHGIRFFETSAKSSINVEEVSRNVTLIPFIFSLCFFGYVLPMPQLPFFFLSTFPLVFSVFGTWHTTEVQQETSKS